MKTQAFVDDGPSMIGYCAHLRGADGMKDRGADVAGGFGQRGVVVANRRARQELASVIRQRAAGCFISRRVVRIASAATSRSSSVDR